MNLHMPQDVESESELRNLAAVPWQIVSPANNQSRAGDAVTGPMSECPVVRRHESLKNRFEFLLTRGLRLDPISDQLLLRPHMLHERLNAFGEIAHGGDIRAFIRALGNREREAINRGVHIGHNELRKIGRDLRRRDEARQPIFQLAIKAVLGL